MIRSRVSRKWQTIIPAEIRKALGIKPGQRLIYELRECAVLVRVERESLMDLYGCLADGKPAEIKAEERDAVYEARVARHNRSTSRG